MGQLQDSYDTNDNSTLGSSDTYWIAQTFPAGATYDINSVELLLYKHSSLSPGTITISIKAVDGNGKPTGADLCSGTIDGDTLTTNTAGEWKEITFSSAYSLSCGTQYAIVARCSGSGNYPFYSRRHYPTAYADGNQGTSANSGSSWTMSSYRTLMFRTYDDYMFSPPYDIITYKRLVAVGNNEVWCEMSAGAMTKLVATTGDIDTADQLNMFEGFQKIFIVNGSNLKVADFINTKLTSEAEITSNIPSKGDLLTQAGDDPAQMSVDYIYYNAITEDHYIYGYTITGTFDTTHDVIDANSNVIISAANLSAVNEATTTPHWYDWTPYNNDTTTYGEMPNKAYLGCLYRGRCVISGNPEYPYQWYMSKIGDPWNFSYSATDALSAVAGNNADAGEIGDIVRAIIPYKDDFLIFACASSMWYLRGDPMSGGSIDSFDETVGIFGANSWCIDNAGTFYFWGTGGIYFSEIQGGVITKPNLLTGLNLPQIIKDEGVDPSTHRICMGYDRKHLGLVIIITKISDGTNSNYWYDLRTQGFFPESCPKECAGYSVFNYQANNEDYSGLLIGCKDGYIRKFDDTAKDDDIGVSDEAIDSYCTIIQPLGDNEEKEGKLTSLTITTAGGASGGDFSDTDGVSYEYHKADNAETVLENIIDGDTAFSSGTLSGTGRQNRIRKKLRGAYLGLKLYNNTANETWAVEKITGEIKPAGKIK